MYLSSHKLGGNVSVFTQYLWTCWTWRPCVTASQLWNQDCCYSPHLQRRWIFPRPLVNINNGSLQKTHKEIDDCFFKLGIESFVANKVLG